MVDKQKLSKEINEILTKLGNFDSRDDDILEITGILVGDVADMVLARDNKELKKQKKDALRTYRKLKKMIRRYSY